MSLGLSGLKIGPKNRQKIAVLWPKIEKTLKFNNALKLLKLCLPRLDTNLTSLNQYYLLDKISFFALF